MTITQFIEKAEEGGWDVERADVAALNGAPVASIERALLDPAAWKAVGKVTGNERKCGLCGKYEGGHEYRHAFHNNRDWWQKSMHRMIDALAEGKTLEQFIETL